jgi:hypothetical protein
MGRPRIRRPLHRSGGSRDEVPRQIVFAQCEQPSSVIGCADQSQARVPQGVGRIAFVIVGQQKPATLDVAGGRPRHVGGVHGEDEIEAFVYQREGPGVVRLQEAQVADGR